MKKIFIVICTLIALCVSSEVNAANTIVRDYPFNKEFQTGMLELCRTFECVENTRLDKAIVYTIGKQVVLIVSDPLNTKQIIIIYQKSKLSSSMKSKVFDQFDRLLGVKSNWSTYCLTFAVKGANKIFKFKANRVKFQCLIDNDDDSLTMRAVRYS